MTSLFDASALVSLLPGEPGAGEVASLLRSEPATASAVNLGEAADRLRRTTPEPEMASQRLEQLLGEGVRVLPCDQALALRASVLRSTHYHRATLAISLPDCIAMATAEQAEAILVTSDSDLCQVAATVGIDVHPIPNSVGVRPEFSRRRR